MKFSCYIPLLKEPTLPYWRLSNVYFSNCLILGLVLPYWGVYLHSIGLTSSQIGISSGLLLTSSIIAPFIWEKLNNRIDNSVKVIRLGMTLACLFSFLLFKLDSFYTCAVFIFFLGFCWQGINPLVESLTLSYLGGLSHYYGQIRLWGSIGFVISVSGLGLAFDTISIGYFPLFLSGFLGLMLASVYAVPNRTHIVKQSQSMGFYKTIQRSGSMGLFMAIFFVQISQGAYISFFSLYLQENDIGMGVTGNLWAAAVIAEVVMFLFVYKLIAKFGAGTLLVFSLFVTAMRWAAIAMFVQLLPILFIAQLGHAFTYSATHSAVLELIRQQFGDKNQHRGIIIYCSLCLGGGTALGAVISGFVWQHAASNTFVFSAIIAAGAVLIAGVWLKNRNTLDPKGLSE